MVDKETIIKNELAYVKLSKNSRGYNWEIKVYENTKDETMVNVIDEVKKFDNLMQDKFGVCEDENS